MYKSRKCKECGKEFIPNSPRQVYCKDIHYRPCPICGKMMPIKQMSDIPRACSKECIKKRMEQTNLKRYGTIDGGNSESAKAKRRQTNLKRYGVENPFQSEEFKQKSKETIQARYGVEYISQSSEIQQKISNTWNSKSDEEIASISDKRRQTCLSVYGVENPAQSKEVQDKIKQTDLKKYGVEYHISSKEIRNKSNKTMLFRYGTIHPMSLETFQNKKKETCIQIYGADHPLRSSKYVEKLRLHYLDTKGYDWPLGQLPESIEKRKNTCLNKYGVPAAFLTPENLEKAFKSSVESGRSRVSRINLEFKELLESLNISCQLEHRLENRFYDICISDKHILIELDPTWTHCSNGNMYSDLDKNYHRDKSRLASKYGYRCIHIFDWDDWDKILNLLYTPEVIYARNCKLVYLNTDDCNLFLQKYHIQGAVSGQLVCLGLVHNGSLVEVMSFGAPRYNNKYQWELLRLCTASNLRITGGASKLFKEFVSAANPDSIISYCNLSKFSGDVYTKLGFRHLRDNDPGIWWSRGEKKVISDVLLRQRGYDQLFGTNYGKGASNEQLMLEHHWRPVYDCGQAVYTYLKSHEAGV